MRFPLSALAAATLFTASCTAPAEKKTTETTTTAAVPAAPPRKASSALNEKGTNDLMSMLTAYYELKDAMVAADTSMANIAAARLMSAAETMKNTLNEDTAHTALQPKVETITKESEAIMSDKQSNIELKRASFEKASDAMYALLKDAKMANAGVYHAYCPMAFNDKGAYWLSNDAEIKNPYFGKKMLECGEVKDSL